MDEVIEKYYETKQKIDDYNEKLEKYKKQILKQLEKDSEKTYKSEKFSVKIKAQKSERINKTDCPKDIWETYKKSSTYTSLDVKKN